MLINDAPAVVRALVSATIATPPVTATQELDAWTRGHPLGDQPSVLSAPVLLIGGSGDTFSSPEMIGDVVAPRFANVRTAQLAHAGHSPHAEQPAAVASILTRFLTALPHARRGQCRTPITSKG